MDHLMLVKNLFNDMFIFLNGKELLSLDALNDVYQGEPLFLALVGGLDRALEVNYNDAMQESYQFYKRHCGRELSETDWEQVVAEIRAYNERWGNDWCKGIILALLELLEREEKDRNGKKQAEGIREEGLDDIEAAA